MNLVTQLNCIRGENELDSKKIPYAAHSQVHQLREGAKCSIDMIFGNGLKLPKAKIVACLPVPARPREIEFSS